MTPDHADIAAAFDQRAATYRLSDWHRQAAERLVELCAPAPGASVLDAGTGTGFAAIAAARKVGPSGRVVGVDLSTGMLREARAAAGAAALSQIQFLQGDATRLEEFDGGSFDAVICAAGLLYMPVDPALAEWHRLLKPGGTLGFSGMAEGSPLPGRLFRECAASSGLALPDPSAPLGTEERCTAALRTAGFSDACAVRESVSFSATDLEHAWDSNLRSANHQPVRALSAASLENLRRCFEQRMAAAAAAAPTSLTQAQVLYARGRRPSGAVEHLPLQPGR